jgi:hypothetical protein
MPGKIARTVETEAISSWTITNRPKSIPPHRTGVGTPISTRLDTRYHLALGDGNRSDYHRRGTRGMGASDEATLAGGRIGGADRPRRLALHFDRRARSDSQTELASRAPSRIRKSSNHDTPSVSPPPLPREEPILRYEINRYAGGFAVVTGKVEFDMYDKDTVSRELPLFEEPPTIEFVRDSRASIKPKLTDSSTTSFTANISSSLSNGTWTWIAKGKLVERVN